MTLKTLCSLYKECNQDISKCSILKSQYMHEKTDLATEDLSLCDVVDLRPYLLCDTLAIYEYLGGSSKEFSQYSTMTCCRDEDEVEEDYNIDEILKCSYDDFFSSLCDIISSYTRHGFSKDEENFLVVVGYFIQQVILAVEVYQLRDVYEYYRALDCSEDEFISMLPDDIKPLAVENIEYLKSEYNDFNIATPSDMESVIDSMYACNQDIINILRECTK